MVAFGKNDGTTRSGQLERECLNEKQEFTATLISRHPVEPSVRQALIAFGLLGGLGSRARHGMGSVALLSLQADTEKWSAPDNEADYIKQVRALFTALPFPADEPPFTAFWANSRIE